MNIVQRIIAALIGLANYIGSLKTQVADLKAQVAELNSEAMINALAAGEALVAEYEAE